MKRAAFLVLLLPLAAGAAPALRCEPERADLGELPWGTNVVASILVRNDGDGPLHIEKVRACCGAEAAISATNVPPGGSAVLTVNFRAQGRSGPFRRSVYLASDDPAEPQRRILLEGTVLPPPQAPATPVRPGLPPAEIPEGVDVLPRALVYVSPRSGAPRYLRVRSTDPARPLDAAVPPAPGPASGASPSPARPRPTSAPTLSSSSASAPTRPGFRLSCAPRHTKIRKSNHAK